MERSWPEQPLTESLASALRGAVFPLSVEQLVWLARENEAPASVISLLSSLPRGSFVSPAAVQQTLESQAAGGGDTRVVDPAAPSSR